MVITWNRAFLEVDSMVVRLVDNGFFAQCNVFKYECT